MHGLVFFPICLRFPLCPNLEHVRLSPHIGAFQRKATITPLCPFVPNFVHSALLAPNHRYAACALFIPNVRFCPIGHGCPLWVDGLERPKGVLCTIHRRMAYHVIVWAFGCDFARHCVFVSSHPFCIINIHTYAIVPLVRFGRFITNVHLDRLARETVV